MSDHLVETLFDLYATRKEVALRAGQGEVVKYIFHKNGQPIAQNSTRNVFKRILKKAKMRDMRVKL